jgi:hypothetical protein
VSEDVIRQPVTTGHPVVDEVLASMAGLEDRPAGEHVAVFEAAHDRLRGALSEAGDQDPGTAHGVESHAPAAD